ncbi:MAG: cell envelope integrity EipB family protein [Alphaproteobacteria bacterium]|nr:cell envelope integrity EipB family protein [Alphaproteobacteria bacterium]
MKDFLKTLLACVLVVCPVNGAQAAGAAMSEVLAPHKALYDVKLVATRSGSQVINISGKMFYEWQPTCEAWVTDHRFNLFYEYADSPGMTVTSDFSTYEPFDGKSFDFASRRKRDGELYEELRGHAAMDGKEKKGGGVARYSLPSDLSFDLKPGMYFPMKHTVEMVRRAKAGDKIFSAHIFDGSDEEGPVEINTFIGKSVNPLKTITPSDKLSMELLNTPAWNIRMAVFPDAQDEDQSDYEMSMVFHENGVISDMLIEYEDFSVSQKLVALEKLPAVKCPNP